MSDTAQREKIIIELAEVSPLKAKFMNSIISKVPFKELVPFFKIRASHLTPYSKKDFATIKALEEWERKDMEKKIANGSFSFSSIYDMVDFIQSHYLGKKLVRGAKPFYADVVIKLNETGNMLNDSHHSNEGKATRISQKEESQVYEWLFLNQEKIGFAPVYISDADIRKQREKEVLTERKSLSEEKSKEELEITRAISAEIKKAFSLAEEPKKESSCSQKKEEEKESPASLQIIL